MIPYTWGIEQYKGIKVLWIESKEYMGYDIAKSIINELDQTMFLPNRVIYKGGRDTWNGTDFQNKRSFYVSGTTDRQKAVKSIVMDNL